MLKKEEVYVRVSSEKKAQKLKELFEMFGEDYNIPHHETIIICDEDWFGLWHDQSDSNVCLEGKTKVSLKELRNILEFEHNDEKKELEVGKWYKHSNDEYPNWLVYLGYNNTYGFTTSGEWCDDDNNGWIDYLGKYSFTEATSQEVEEALINEAKKRYKVGDKLSEVQKDSSRGNRIFNINLSHQYGLCDLWIDDDNGYSSCIFKNGKWAEVIETEKSLEERVKELEKKVKQLENG